MASRVYVQLTTRQYADAYGLSMSAARRRIIKAPGALKVGRTWKLPVTATEYAKRTGKSAAAVRRKGFRATPQTVAQTFQNLNQSALGALRKRAAQHWLAQVGSKPKTSTASIVARVNAASPQQLQGLLSVTYQTVEWDDPMWRLANDPSNALPWYH